MCRYDPNKHTEKSLNFPITNCSISFEKSSVLIKHFKVATVTQYLLLLLQAIFYIQIVLCGGNQKGKSVFNYSLFSKFPYDLWQSIFQSIFTLLIMRNFTFYSAFNVPSCTIVNPRFIQRVNLTFFPVAYCTIPVIHLQNVRTDTPFKTFFSKKTLQHIVLHIRWIITFITPINKGNCLPDESKFVLVNFFTLFEEIIGINEF